MSETLTLTPTERITVTAHDTGALVVEVRYGEGDPPPSHLHPAQDERFTVLQGELRAIVAGREHRLAAGDVLEIPRGTAHRMWNAGPGEAVARWETTPAGRTLDWFRDLERATGGRKPNVLKLLPLLVRYRDVFRLSRG